METYIYININTLFNIIYTFDCYYYRNFVKLRLLTIIEQIQS